MADYGIAQGFAEATGKLPGLALNLAQMQQQGQHMRALEADSQQRLALDARRFDLAEKTGRLQQEGLEVANRKAKMEADALADSMKLLPVNETLTKMGITRPAEQKLFLEYAGPHVETGEASGQPVIQKQHAKAIWEKMRGDVDFGIKLGATRGSEINKEIAELQGQLTNPETSGKIKPEQAQQIQAQIDKLVEQRTIADNGVKMLKQKQRAANKENIQTMRDASGTWVEVNTVTGEQTPLPAGMVPEKIAVEQIKAGKETAPHTTTETSPDGKQERTVIWDGATKQYQPMQGAAGAWHAAKSQVINISQASKDAESFNTWTPEAKTQAFTEQMITGRPPVSAQGMQSNSRAMYDKQYQQFKVNGGFTPQMVAAMQSDYKAGTSSLTNMKRQEAPMRAFVENINTQVDYAKQLFEGLKRTDIRLLNVPLRELKTKIIGSGLERQYELFLQEISMEANKLAQGSSASIAQIPEGNRKEWLAIHDINLPLKEILPVLEGTKKMANMRLGTWVSAKDFLRSEINSIGLPEKETAAPPTNGFNIDAITAELNRRKGK